MSEGRSPEITGEPSVVKNTWPLVVTLTEFVSTTVPGTGCGLIARVGAVVSEAPIRNGMLSVEPAIERTSKVYGADASSPVRVADVAVDPTRSPVLVC